MSDSGPAVDPIVPAAPPEAPPEHSALDELPELEADVEAAKRVLYEALGDEEKDGDEEESAPPKTEEAPEEPEKKQAAPEDHVEQLKQILGNMSEEQRTELLGTADSAFAALTSKRRRLHNESQQVQEQKQHLEQVRGQFDQLLERAQKNPVEALQVLGWEVDDLAKFIESGEIPLERLQNSMETKFKKELEGLKEELENTRYQTNLERWHSDVARGIQAIPKHAEHFPNLAKKLEQGKIDPRVVHERVINAQSNYFRQNRQKLELGAALGYIERELEQQRQLWLDENPNPSQAGAVKSAKSPEVPSEPVLNNKLASESRTPKSSVNYDEMDESELREEARRLLFEE